MPVSLGVLLANILKVILRKDEFDSLFTLRSFLVHCLQNWSLTGLAVES